jgi:hypothetical protein
MLNAPCLPIAYDIRWERVGVARVSSIVCHVAVKMSIR